jgi:transposase InsO family protein
LAGGSISALERQETPEAPAKAAAQAERGALGDEAAPPRAEALEGAAAPERPGAPEKAAAPAKAAAQAERGAPGDEAAPPRAEALEGAAAPEKPGAPEKAAALEEPERPGAAAAGFSATRPEAVAEEPELQAVLDEALTPGPELEVDEPVRIPRFMGGGPRHGRRLVKKEAFAKPALTAEQRLLLLDTWRRSGLPASDFAGLVGLSKHSLYAWKKAFDTQGPAGLLDKPRGGPRGLRLPELTKRTILMLKESNPAWGCQRISDLLLRGPALPASPATVAKVLHEAGYTLSEEPTHPHPDKVRSFERAKPNQLWQTDLFTFMLKRQNRRVYLVGFMDDHSRFLVSYGLHASQSTALVLECLRVGITNYGAPAEILTDNGAQYVTWRGKSLFARECEKRGIQQLVAAPRRPQTLGKMERFWGTLWREFLEAALFVDLGEAQARIGHFIDYYNFQRPHQALGGLVPADRFFGAAPEVLKTLKARVAAHALELARHGVSKPPFYLTGQVGGKPFSVHAEGERVILTRGEGQREEVALTEPQPVAEAPAPTPLPAPVCPLGLVTGPLAEEGLEEPPPPGVSSLDDHFPPCQGGGET